MQDEAACHHHPMSYFTIDHHGRTFAELLLLLLLTPQHSEH